MNRQRFGVLILGVVLGAGLMAIVQQQPHAMANEAMVAPTVMTITTAAVGNGHYVYRLLSTGKTQFWDVLHPELKWQPLD